MNSSKSSSNNQQKDNNLSWTFKEPKISYNLSWYFKMSLAFAILIAIAVFLIKSWSTATLFLVVLITMIIYTKRPRESIKFLVDNDGVYINDKLYPIDHYKSFSVREHRGFFTISLLPIKKLDTELMVSFEKPIGEELVDLLAKHIPLVEHEEGFIDSLIKKIGL